MKLWWSRIGSGRRRIVWRGFNTANTLVIQAVAGWTIWCTGTYTLNRFLTPIHLSCSCLGIQDETCRYSWYLLKPSKYNSNLKEWILPSQLDIYHGELLPAAATMKKMIDRPGLNETVAIISGLYCEYLLFSPENLRCSINPSYSHHQYIFIVQIWVVLRDCTFLFSENSYILIKNMEIQILCLALYAMQFFKFLKCISCNEINIIYKDINDHEGI